jgi:hypothetical protein
MNYDKWKNLQVDSSDEEDESPIDINTLKALSFGKKTDNSSLAEIDLKYPPIFRTDPYKFQPTLCVGKHTGMLKDTYA